MPATLRGCSPSISSAVGKSPAEDSGPASDTATATFDANTAATAANAAAAAIGRRRRYDILPCQYSTILAFYLKGLRLNAH